MKEQKFACIDNDKLQELNKEGWFVKQVIKKQEHGLLCEATYYYVLLEKEKKDE